MPRTTKPAKTSTSTAEKIQDEPSAHEDSSSSDQEQDPGIFIQPSQVQLLPNMFMPYIESPKMDWRVNDGLYHRFLKWCLMCENILECELAMLPEKRQCKKVIAWSGDFGMDQYVSCNLSTDKLKLDTIWEKFEEFFKPNQMKSGLDLTCLQASGKKTSQLMNGTMQYRPRLLWLRTPQKQPRSFTGTSSGFS